MQNKTRISVVSYLNARPFVFGMEHQLSDDEFIVEKDIPSTCATKLIGNQTDIGLIPVAMISSLKEAHLITSYGIVADGKVDSVVLVSHSPLSQIKKIVLDQESRTSVLLAKILAKELWNIHPAWIHENTESSILQEEEFTAAVIIGDRALKYKSTFPYCYDLAECWKELTGLPFVFAAWVSNKLIDDGIINKLETAFHYGVSHREEIFPILAAEYPEFNISQYLQKRILYKIDDQALEGLQLFLKKIKEISTKN
ncbi:MAG: menaquinone biosynthesis protein [Bacteroidia bacterium]|nr:menaquinone biosynthesis protein [Bacteroidota bacterium]MBP6511055.1 menaquinone biosynthesis protein [Bacteroidia bacterium]MBP7243785.1 menaquinone biosynthesis protein [Bacteroidia bacterium]